MPLLLEIVSENKDLLGSDCVREFREDGGSIGRSLQNDWILPDPDHFISGRHATVDFQSGAYYLADMSTNGVFVNDEEQPIGRGNPRRLFNGDRLKMGEFVFVVTLDEGEDLDMPPEEPMTVVPDHIERLIPEETFKTGVDLLDEEEMTGDDEFEAALFGNDAVKEETRHKSNGRMNDQPNPFGTESGKKQSQNVDIRKLLDAFMRGLGISRADLHPTTDPIEVMENAGRVIKEFVDGTADLLSRRGGVKTMFKLDQTTIMPKHNNPLKLADNVHTSIMQLLVGKEGEYLRPEDAVREVCRDLKIHQGAMMDAMMGAFAAYIGRFDPETLRENFDKTLDSNRLLKATNQLKYWQLYCDLYPIMTEQGVGQLPQQFADEFVRAYQKCIAQAEREERKAKPKAKAKAEAKEEKGSYDGEELVDQTEEATYNDQF